MIATTFSIAAKRRQNDDRQHDAADGGLQVEADQRNFPRHGLRMRDQFVLARALHGGEREQAGVIAEVARELRLLDRLLGAADHAGDHDDRAARPFGRGARGKLQHRPVKPGLADRELRGVDADREPAGAGVEIVAGQRPLPPRIELALRIRAPADAPE